MKDKVIIVGDGGHAKIVIDILQEMGTYDILGITSLNEEKKTFYGLPVLGNDDILDSFYAKGVRNIALGIGGFKDNDLRTKVFKRLSSQGFNIVNAIHPRSIISKSVKMGQGVVIFAGVILNSEVRLGNNVIVATGSTIDHQTIIKDHCLISAGVTIGANTIIDESTLCALGSKVISSVKIGKNCLVAAGAVVVNHINSKSKVFGIPAKEK
jgi:sugar O-acyltransferase (sialic acid O-acetyltransferase NeuD family)